MKIGFVGLGKMGLPMASRVLAAGHEVIGADPSLIRPGTVLSIPDSLPAPGTTTGGQAPSR